MTDSNTLAQASSSVPDNDHHPETDTREPFVEPELVRHETLPTVTGFSGFFPP